MKSTLVTSAAVGRPYALGIIRGEVLPACGSRAGYWVCLTHPQDHAMSAYRNQLQKDIHIGDGQAHELAWFCAEHGDLEAP